MFSHPRVSLLGLGATEQRALAAMLTFAAPKSPTYILTSDLAAAQFWILDADDVSALETLKHRGDGSRVVLVGTPRGLAQISVPVAARLPRPCEPAQVVRALDAVLAVQKSRLAATVRLHTQRPKVPARLRRATQAPQRSDDQGDTDFSNAVLSAGEPRLRAILLVDADDQSRHQIHARLRRLGYEVEAVARVETAMRRVSERAFGFVLINIGTDHSDGWGLCRHLRKMAWPQGQRPKLVMLVSRLRSVDRIRGLLAGCDDLLIKPLTQVDLINVFSRHDDAFERSFGDTLVPSPIALARVSCPLSY